jgi:hypothetical protein
VSDLDPLSYMHRPVYVAHSLFIEGSHTTKNTVLNTDVHRISQAGMSSCQATELVTLLFELSFHREKDKR